MDVHHEDTDLILPETVLWQPDLMPPNSWLYPAILYHERISTIRPDRFWGTPRGCPPKVAQQFRRSAQLSDALGDLHVPCQFSALIGGDELNDLLDALAFDHRRWVEEQLDSSSEQSREWLHMVHRRESSRRAVQERRSLERDAEANWEALRAAQARLKAESDLRTADLRSDIQRAESDLRRIRLAASEVGEIASGLCRVRADSARLISRLRSIADDEGIPVPNSESFEIAAGELLTALLARGSLFIATVSRLEGELERSTAQWRDASATRSIIDIDLLERRDAELRRALSSLEPQAGASDGDDRELADTVVQRLRSIHGTEDKDDQWSMAFLHAKGTEQFAEYSHEVVARHPAFLTHDFEGTQVVLAPQRLMKALFDELSGLECDVRGWRSMRGWNDVNHHARHAPIGIETTPAPSLVGMAMSLPVPPRTMPLQEVVEFRLAHQRELTNFRRQLAELAETAAASTEDPMEVANEVRRVIRTSCEEVAELLQRRKALRWRTSLHVLRSPRDLRRLVGEQVWELGKLALVGNTLGNALQARAAPITVAFGTVEFVGPRFHRQWLTRRAEREMLGGPLAYLYELQRNLETA